MRSFITNFINDESGASAAEYALILVVVGLAIVTGAGVLASSMNAAMQSTAKCIGDPNTAGNCK